MSDVSIQQAIQLAIGYQQAGRSAEAEAIYRRILAQFPDQADALNLLGVLECQSGHNAAAIDLIGRAIAINPNVAAYHSNLGECCRRAERWDEAIAGFRHAISLRPDSAVAHSNLGSALCEQGRLDEAIDACRRAIALKPDLAEAHNNLGNALKEQGQQAAAIDAYRQAVQLSPADALAYTNLGSVLWELGRRDEAIEASRRAIALKPDQAEAYNTLGNALKDQGRLDEAIVAFHTSLAVKPDFAGAASNVLLCLHYHPEHNARSILQEHRRWAGKYADALAAEVLPHPNDRTSGRRLRVGYVSPDFRAHPVGQMLLPLFEHHDRRQVEVVAYSDVRLPDSHLARLRALADEWHDVARSKDAELSDQIRRDRIDILVDLTLHTGDNRMLLFARKPAPVQVTMLGLPSTTGLSTIDYRLTDPYLDPPGATDTDYTEQSIRLPHTFWCYSPGEDSPPVSSLPAERNGFVTFGCLNQFAKVSRPALELWAKILAALPGSRLVLHAPTGITRDRVRGLFHESGIAPDRITFVARQSLHDYLRVYHSLDLCLDPFPCGGGTTTMDALWMGVPVITLAGRTAVGRGGTSILSNLGLPELITPTPDQYLALALALAGDRPRLSALRVELRPRMLASPLMDGRQYAADVEAAFRMMWSRWCGS